VAVDANTVSEVVVETTKWLDATTLYYTYSTIAQTLAGAFGILGAFTLFRLQSITQSIKGICTAIYNGAVCQRNIIKIPFAEEDWNGFSRAIEGRSLDEVIYDRVSISLEQFENYRNKLKTRLIFRETVISYLKATLYLTAVTIALSLFFLPLTPVLAEWIYFSAGFLIITVILSILCLYKYVQLIKQTLRFTSNNTKDEQDNK